MTSLRTDMVQLLLLFTYWISLRQSLLQAITDSHANNDVMHNSSNCAPCKIPLSERVYFILAISYPCKLSKQTFDKLIEWWELFLLATFIDLFQAFTIHWPSRANRGRAASWGSIFDPLGLWTPICRPIGFWDWIWQATSCYIQYEIQFRWNISLQRPTG